MGTKPVRVDVVVHIHVYSFLQDENSIATNNIEVIGNIFFMLSGFCRINVAFFLKAGIENLCFKLLMLCSHYELNTIGYYIKIEVAYRWLPQFLELRRKMY